MPVKAGSPIDPEATRARVLASASKLFYERGVHVVGVDEIAQHAGASKLTVYRNFGSKAGLVEAVVANRSDRTHAWLEHGIADVPPGPDRVLALFDMFTGWYAEDGYLGCGVLQAAVETRAKPGPIPRRHLARYLDLFRRLLAECGIAEPAGYARRMLLLIEGATVVSSIEGTAEAGRDARAMAELLLTTAPKS
ncbi:TetR/AcrR family transcriptional regulator [Actinocrispum wychmicini]|uniref:TetR family transcriptional regulator n=1 Tax=Actinocrispum wychmicini TaxID=1213861 RepID=A0A4V2S4E8_9PSEU|nr:TetR/AcrR family transcriptional regulator [Actinocrispum wychmicini]TCO48010.1 TetR family transcriptional regulator [Actinocrispum wychmicini]